MTGFVSGKSKVGEGNSRSSDTPHFSWFIEPYERWVYLPWSLTSKDRPGSLFQPGPGSAKSAGTGILPGPGL